MGEILYHKLWWWWPSVSSYSQPRIVDPANPVNNVWMTGFKNYKPGERISDYEPGDGNAFLLRERIHTIDLSQTDGMAKKPNT